MEVMNERNFSLKIDEFLNALLEPSMTKAVEVSKECIKQNEDIKPFWEQVIVPSMYAIGQKWADNEITVGEEHTATSICQRVMSEYYEQILNNSDIERRKIIVTISPKELHQIGGRMVADLLELNGFDICFLDSHTSLEEILAIIKKEDIREILISTTLVTSLDRTEKLISQIKEAVKKEIKIYVGGQAYFAGKKVKTNADVLVTDIDFLINELKKEKNDRGI